MPIFNYRCPQCSTECRILIAVDRVASHKAKCKDCSAEMVRMASVPLVAELETTDGYRSWTRFKDTNQKRKAHSESLTKKNTPVK